MSANDKTEKLKKFKQTFLNLTQDALDEGVPIQNVILELEMEKFRIQAILLNRMAEAEAAKMMPLILPGPAGLKLPPGSKN